MRKLGNTVDVGGLFNSMSCVPGPNSLAIVLFPIDSCNLYYCSMMEPLVRGSSGRAMKLRKEKDRERQKKLRRLKASRGVKGTHTYIHVISRSMK